MLAAGRSAAADSEGKVSSGTPPQRVLVPADGKASAIAELQEFRPPPAPWQIRYRKQLVTGLAVAVILALPALGAYLWRTFGPSPLDKIVLPAERDVLERETTPLRLPPPPPASRSIDVPQKRTDMMATTPRVEPGRGTAENHSSVTHTKRTGPVTAASPQSTARVQAHRPASVECSEAVAALGLCAPVPTAKAGQ